MMNKNPMQDFNATFDQFFASVSRDKPPKVKTPFVREYYDPGFNLPELALDVFYYPADPGKRGSCGEPLEPCYPAGAEIQSVYLGQYDITPLLAEEWLVAVEASLMNGREE